MLEYLRALGQTARRRLPSQRRQTLAFAGLGVLTGQLIELPEWIKESEGRGLESWLPAVAYDMLVVSFAGLLIMFGIRLFTEDGADLMRRPGKFLLLLTSITAFATALAWSLHLLIDADAAMREAAHLRPQIFHFWMQTLLWGGLVGWLYLLNLQRTANQLALDGLLSRRVLLARQLARTRLGHARAQIDPAMVAGILSKVHVLYREDPGGASFLLDRLIAYLRLAMNRRPAELPGADMALIHALLALREAEFGIAVAVKVEPGTLISETMFPAVCAQLDTAIASGAGAIQLMLSARGVTWDVTNKKEIADVAS